MNNSDWQALIEAATNAATSAGLPLAEVSLHDIARHAGISRATLYRRIGSRQALDDAVRRAGIDPGGLGDVRERATEAAADLIEHEGLAAMTLDAVAERADCSVRALHTQLGGRDGLVAAVFERYSPLPRVERVLVEADLSLADGVRAIYQNIVDATSARPGLLRAMVGDVLLRPDGSTARLIRELYLPRVFGSVVPWLFQQIRAGELRPMPIAQIMKLLVGPMAAHVALGTVLAAGTASALPDREEIVTTLTDAFIRAVARAPD